MPYNLDDIQKLLDLNNNIEKSRITSLYACVPRGCEVFTGFEQSRNFAFDNLSWDYRKRLINQTFDCRCDFIYLLNSPRPLDIENPDFPKKLEKLELLLSELRKIGVKKLRVASAQLMTYIAKHYPGFDVLASTSLEYKTICEYQNFIYLHKGIKQLVPSHEVNKNFKLLINLKKQYKNIEIELMVNEGCMKGCPNRILHEYDNIDSYKIINNNTDLSNIYSTIFCNYIAQKYPIYSYVIGNNIFPWDIDEYAQIGIINFKFAGRDGFIEYFEKYLKSFKLYLQGIDNIKTIGECTLAELTHHSLLNPILKRLKVKDYKKYLPKIEYFKKYGHLCNIRCGVECHYCYKCSENIQRIYERKQKEQIKMNTPFCIITNR